jgi:hypothetical protein
MNSGYFVMNGRYYSGFQVGDDRFDKSRRFATGYRAMIKGYCKRQYMTNHHLAISGNDFIA